MLGAFMSGLTSGMESMLNLRQKADELRMQLDSNEQLRAAAKGTGEAQQRGGLYDPASASDVSATGRDFAIPTDTTPTTGSGGYDASDPGTVRPSSSGSGTGGWGPHAKTVIDTLKGLGWKDGAIQGVLANGLAEGGFKDNWAPGDSGYSMGHFQYYARGELPGYLKWAGANGVTDPHDSAAQTQYLAKRMEDIHPGFGQIDNPYDATDIVGTRFERYKGAAPGQRYGQLATAQKYYGMPNYGIGTTAQPSTIAGPAVPAGPQLRVGGGIAGGTGQPAPGYETPTPAPGPALAVGGGIAGGQGQPAPGYGPSTPPITAAAPTAALLPPTTASSGDNRGMLAPNDPRYQQWVKDQIASGRMPASASTVGKPEGLDKRVRKTSSLGDISGGALA